MARARYPQRDGGAVGIRANAKHLLVSGLCNDPRSFTPRGIWAEQVLLTPSGVAGWTVTDPSFPGSKATLFFPAP